MIEGVGKPFNFIKPTDQKRFGKLGDIEKKVETLKSQEEAEVVRRWMILDHVEPSTEQAAFYIKKLEKVRKLYKGDPLSKIAWRLGVESPELNSEYSEYVDFDVEEI